MKSTALSPLSACRLLATVCATALSIVLPAAVAFAQPVRVMPVIQETAPTYGGPLGFALVGDVLYFNIAGGSTGLTLWKSDGTAQGTVPVKEVNTYLWSSYYAASGGKLYFDGLGAGGSGLWVSDGTVAGTRLLWTGTVRQVVDVNGTLFFADDARLYKSDGTPEGTVTVKDYGGFSGPRGLRAVGGTLFFASYTAAGVAGLWKSDGTTAGTVLVKSFASLTTYLISIEYRGKLLFAADDGTTGLELWVSDGTTAGTSLVKDIFAGPAGSSLGFMGMAGAHVYFGADNGATGRELWRTDGTPAGTTMVADIDPGTAGSNPRWMTALGNLAIFTANTAASGADIWKSDGTSVGTAIVKEIPNATSPYHPDEYVVANGSVCFVVEVGNRTDLWRTDGTEAGTLELMQGIGDISVNPPLVSTGTRVYVKRTTGSSFQLWSSDCISASGNQMVKEFSFPVSNYTTTFNSLTAMGDHLLLRADTAANGNELWRVDATGGTLLKDIEPGTGSGLEWVAPPDGNLYPKPPAVRPWARVGNTFYFRGVTTAHGGELWRSDGTAQGTMLVKDIAQGPAAHYNDFTSYPDELTAVGNTVFFVASDGVNGKELWKSDGTDAGTALVKAIVPEAWYGPTALMNVSGTLYFRADDGINGTELWKSDGTAAGTMIVKDIVAGAGSSYGTPIANLAGTVMFAAYVPGSGVELWRSDGSAAATTLVKAIRPGNTETGIGAAAVMNGILYFPVVTNSGSAKAELWRSDGTDAGTYPIFASPSWSFSRLTAIGSALYFWTGDFQGGSVWTSDGTPAGTVQLASVGAENILTPYSKFVALNGIVYFLGSEWAVGTALWRTNGTLAGTYKLDLFPGFRGSTPAELTVLGDRLWFIANDGVNPRSLYYYVPRPPEAEITRLSNLSTRAQVFTGDNVLIGGFVIGGSLPKTVIVRARGPSLSQAGVPNVLANPQVQLFSGQTQIASNDDWGDAPNAAAIQASGFAPSDAQEAAILMTLGPGAYTAIVSGAGGTTGTGIFEVFEVSDLTSPLVNISTRGLVQAGGGVLIGGFIIQGQAPQKVLVRARGPSMPPIGNAIRLANPLLQLFSGQTGIASNDNWQAAANAVEIDATGMAPSEFSESAILMTLQPGAYTAVVSGVSGGGLGSGIAIVEVFRLD